MQVATVTVSMQETLVENDYHNDTSDGESEEQQAPAEGLGVGGH